MYHSITEEDESGTHPFYRITTPPATFDAQMESLYEQGYTICSLGEASSLIGSTTLPSGKRVAITFDDGYQDVYRAAFPTLQRLGFTATVFLPTAYIGDSTLKFKGRNCLTWSEVRELQKYGIAFGSHTVSHPQLRELSENLIQQEVVQSKNTIEDKTSVVVDSFAYPYAFPQWDTAFRTMLRELLQSAGYASGVCTIVGRAGAHCDPLFLPRLPMNGADDPELLRAKLKGAYSWVGWTQSTLKKARSYQTRSASISGRSNSLSAN